MCVCIHTCGSMCNSIFHYIGGQNIYNTMKHNYAAGLVIMAMENVYVYMLHFPPVWKFEPVLPATCFIFISSEM